MATTTRFPRLGDSLASSVDNLWLNSSHSTWKIIGLVIMVTLAVTGLTLFGAGAYSYTTLEPSSSSFVDLQQYKLTMGAGVACLFMAVVIFFLFFWDECF